MNSQQPQSPPLDGLAPSSALIILDALHLGSAEPAGSPQGFRLSFHGNVLAAIICDPQVYEKVECKLKDLKSSELY